MTYWLMKKTFSWPTLNFRRDKLMFLIKIEDEEKVAAINAEEFKLTNDREYVYFYRDNKPIALLKMDKVRCIFNSDGLNII